MRVYALALSLSLISAPVAADAVGPGMPRMMPAPQDCPPGAFARMGTGSHGFPPRCEASTCETECAEGLGPCVEIGICVGPVMFGRGGSYDAAFGPCETDADCEAFASEGRGMPAPTCQVARRCAGLPGEVPTEVPPPAAPPAAAPDRTEEAETASGEALSEPATRDAPDAGCGCRAAGGSGGAGSLALTLLAGVCVVRRRRSRG